MTSFVMSSTDARDKDVTVTTHVSVIVDVYATITCDVLPNYDASDDVSHLGSISSYIARV